MELRYYQKQAIEDFFNFTGNPDNWGKHPIIVLPTGCVSGDTIINVNRCKVGGKRRIDKMYKGFNGFNPKKKYDKKHKTFVRSFNGKTIQLNEINNILFSGIKDLLELKLENGNSLKATPDHKIMTNLGWVKMEDLTENCLVMCDTLKAEKSHNTKKKNKQKKHDIMICNLWYHPFASSTKTKKEKRGYTKRIEIHRAIYESYINNISIEEYKNILKKDELKAKKMKYVDPSLYFIHHIDENHYNNDINNLQKLTKQKHSFIHSEKSKFNFNQGIPVFSKVKSIKYFGKDNTYDISCIENHNFVANGIVVHNSGKSIIQAHIVDKVLQYAGTRVLLITHQAELIKQNYLEFVKNFDTEKINIGIYSAGLKCRDTRSRVLFAGIQSVYKKAWILGWFDLILVDEVHLVNNKNSGMYRTFLEEMQKINSKIIIAGLSATPYRMKAGLLTEGDEALFDEICHETTIKELIDPNHYRNKDKKQYLCNLISKNAVNKVDLTNVHIRAGEYKADEMESAFMQNDLVSLAVKEIQEYTTDRKKVLIFCAGISHCEDVYEKMKALNMNCAFVHSQQKNEINQEILRNFKEGIIKYILNIGILCLDEETEILTSEGFVGIDEMNENYKIASWKTDGGIEFKPPLRIIRRKRFGNENMVSFGNKKGFSASIRVTENHRMVIRNGQNNKKIKTISAKETFNYSSICIPAFGECCPEKIYAITPRYKQNEKNHISVTAFHYRKRGFSQEEAKKVATIQVKRLREMRYKHPFELTEKECFFIGFWLGDGTKSCGRFSISQSERYIDNIEKIENIMEEIGISYTKKIYKPDKKSKYNSVRWSLPRGTGGYSQSIKNGYFPLEPYFEKEGTKLFFGLSKKQLTSLLEGFYLADGIHHGKFKTKRKEITGTQIQLYKLLQEICSMRGISATIYKKTAPKKNNHTQQYKFIFNARKNWVYTPKKNIKIERIFKEERVWCVTSSTSFLICRRKGKVFVTGNTTGFNEKDIDCIVLLRSTMSPGFYYQQVGRGLRIFPGKENCLILDFGKNIERLGPIDKIEIRTAKNGTSTIETAPQKECPSCRNLIALSAMVCPECGFEYPVKEKHEETASGADIISKYKPPKPVNVESVQFWRHSKAGKPDSLRVDYYLNMYEKVSTWICIEHEGYARNKALEWLDIMTEGTELEYENINSVTEALDGCKKFRKPFQIVVDKNEKFPKITGYIFSEEQEEKDLNKKIEDIMF